MLRIDVHPSPTGVSPPPASFTQYMCLGGDNKVLQIGRKIGQVLLPTDKSVSREHCRVSLGDGAGEHGRIRKDDDKVEGETWLLENIGKWTFRVVDGHQSTAAAGHDPGDSSGTDDEAPLSAQNTPTDVILSEVSKSLVPNAILRQITTPSVVLEAPMVIQVGKHGSTVILTPLRWITSGSFHKPNLPGFQAEMDASTTHIVTEQKLSSTKQLTAWARGLVFVTPSFLEDMAAGKEIDPTQYDPKASKPEMWNKKPNPLLWKGCTMLVKEGSNKQALVDLVKAAGANVSYFDGTTSIDPQLLEGSTCFALQAQGRKLKDISLVKEKDLAVCLVDQKPLVDVNGNEIVPNIMNSKSGETNHDADAANMEAKDQDDGFPPPESPPMAVEPSRARGSALTHVEDRQEDEHDLSEQASQATKQLGPPADRNEKGRNDVESTRKRSRESETPSRSKRSRDTIETPSRGTRARPRGTPETPSRGTRKAESAQPIIEETVKEVEDSSSPDVSTRQARSQPQPTVQEAPLDGWFTVAPRGAKRNVRPPTAEEMLSDALPTAETVVRDLLSAMQDDRDENVRPAASTRTGRGGSSTFLDFKRFKKNQVPRERTVCNIEMESVLPTDSDAMTRDFEDELRELEAQQRQADALFSEQMMNPAKGRRRRR